MKRYCADTSSLVAAWVERYPPEFFPDIWEKFGDLIRQGRIFAPDEVRAELDKRSKDVVAWLDQFDGFFLPTDEAILQAVTEVLADFPKLVMERKVAYAADPFVVSAARMNGAMVLTEEGFGSAGKPRIPFVCRELRVEYCNLLDLIRAERWIIGRPS